jgi:hypothetical protein
VTAAAAVPMLVAVAAVTMLVDLCATKLAATGDE